MLVKNGVALGLIAFLFAGLCLSAPLSAADDAKSKKTKDDKKKSKSKDKDKDKEKDKKSAKALPSEPSKATTYEEAMAEGDERLSMMEHGSAQKSYEKALQLARNNEQKGKACKGLASAYNNLGMQEKSLETVLDSAQYYPELDTPEKSEAARKQYVNTVYREAWRIAANVIGGEDTKLRHEVVDAALAVPDMGTAWQAEWHCNKMGLYATKEIKELKKVDEWQKKALALPDVKPNDVFRIYMTAGRCYAGVAYWSSGDMALYAQARDLYHQALSVPNYLDNQNWENLVMWAIQETYWHSRDYVAVREWCEKIIAINLKKKGASHLAFGEKLRIGESYRAEGNKSEAKKYFDECLGMADKAHSETWRSQADNALKSIQ